MAMSTSRGQWADVRNLPTPRRQRSCPDLPQVRPAECLRTGLCQSNRRAGKARTVQRQVPALGEGLTMIFTLPWPPKELSPNARLHHMAKARAKKMYRSACGWTAKQQGAGRIDAERLTVHIQFVPPDRRARDVDNMLASIKAGLDGLADVIGVDDRHWRISIEVADEIGGMVRVRIGHD